jgi:hypothetical protein
MKKKLYLSYFISTSLNDELEYKLYLKFTLNSNGIMPSKFFLVEYKFIFYGIPFTKILSLNKIIYYFLIFFFFLRCFCT